MVNEGAAPKFDVVLLLVPKMLLVTLGISVVAAVAAAPKENAPVLLPPGLFVLVACCEIALPKAKLELAVDC